MNDHGASRMTTRRTTALQQLSSSVVLSNTNVANTTAATTQPVVGAVAADDEGERGMAPSSSSSPATRTRTRSKTLTAMQTSSARTETTMSTTKTTQISTPTLSLGKRLDRNPTLLAPLTSSSKVSSPARKKRRSGKRQSSGGGPIEGDDNNLNVEPPDTNPNRYYSYYGKPIPPPPKPDWCVACQERTPDDSNPIANMVDPLICSILCDAPNCNREYHLPCVGLRRPPPTDVSWYCPDCHSRGGWAAQALPLYLTRHDDWYFDFLCGTKRNLPIDLEDYDDTNDGGAGRHSAGGYDNGDVKLDHGNETQSTDDESEQRPSRKRTNSGSERQQQLSGSKTTNTIVDTSIDDPTGRNARRPKSARSSRSVHEKPVTTRHDKFVLKLIQKYDTVQPSDGVQSLPANDFPELQQWERVRAILGDPSTTTKSVSLLGKPILMQIPYTGSVWHPGRIVDVRDHGREHLIRFAAGVLGRKSDYLHWVRLREHPLLVGIDIALDTSTSRPQIVWLRSARKYFTDGTCVQSNGSPVKRLDIEAVKTQWFLSSLGFQRDFHWGTITLFKSTTNDVVRPDDDDDANESFDPSIDKHLALAELSAQDRVREWLDLPTIHLHGPHALPIEHRDEHMLPPLTVPATFRPPDPDPSLPGLLPNVRQGLDRMKIVSRFKLRGAALSRDAAFRLKITGITPIL